MPKNARTIKSSLPLNLLLILICGSLLVSLYGKLTFPTEQLVKLDFWVSIFEMCLIGHLLYFRKNWKMWLILAMVFSSWGGYAYFWYSLNKPCHCLGTMIEIPNGVSLSVDVVFFIASLTTSFLLGAKKQWLYISLVLSCLLSFLGFMFANWVYENLILSQ